MVTLYLHEKTSWGRTEGPPVHCFRLCSDEAGKQVVTQWYHGAGHADHREQHARQLNFIDTWARQTRVRIGNRQVWSLPAEEEMHL